MIENAETLYGLLCFDFHHTIKDTEHLHRLNAGEE